MFNSPSLSSSPASTFAPRPSLSVLRARAPLFSVFLPASDIPRFVAHGNVSIGITGQDVILESGLSHLIKELLPLDFGKCALQVQVPVSSPYQTVEQLAGRRIVTSFEVIAGKFFNEIDQKQGRAEAEKTQVEYVGGSVEAACALGMADGIVDLVGESSLLLVVGRASSDTCSRPTLTPSLSSLPSPRVR